MTQSCHTTCSTCSPFLERDGDGQACIFPWTRNFVDCNSADQFQSANYTLAECVRAVQDAGGRFFLYGVPGMGKAGWCQMEQMESPECTEGWQLDIYNFYVLPHGTGVLHAVVCVGVC